MRSLRVLFPGAVYHVTARGNERQLIFRDPNDHRAFLGHVELAVERYGWICHGYCLMGNHYHLLVETPRGNLPVGMRHVNGCHAQAFNRRWRRAGHLFQGRYTAQLIEKRSYLLAVVRYLALNPTRTTPPLCESPEHYRWSSYPALLGITTQPTWLTTDFVLTQFDDHLDSARAQLKRFVQEGFGKEPSLALGGIYLGSDDFIREKSQAVEPHPEIPRAHWQPLRPHLNEIFASSPQPIQTAYRQHGYTLKEISQHLGCHYQTVSRHLRADEQHERQRET